MGLAVYNSIILDLHFPSICYRKLLSPPVVPPLDSAAVGVTKDPGIDDLAEIMPVQLILSLCYFYFQWQNLRNCWQLELHSFLTLFKNNQLNLITR